MKRRNPKFEWETAFVQAGLTGNAGFVGLIMSSLDNGDGQGFFVSAASIARWTGLNEKTVRTQIKTLVDAGWVERTSRGGRRGGQALASTYRLTIPDGAKRALTSAQPEDDGSQPDSSALPVDQRSLHHPLLDLTSLSPGSEISAAVLETLPGEQRDMFMPSFENDGMWQYQPVLGNPVQHQDKPTTPSPLTAREERRQREHHVRTNRDEGLDEVGEPLAQRSERRRYRR